MQLLFRRAGWIALSAVVLTGVIGLYSLVGVRPAQAQGTNDQAPAQTTGVIKLNRGEHALIGLLLPAVQRARAPYVFVLVDGDGTARLTIPIDANVPNRFRSNYLDIFVDGEVWIVKDPATGKTVRGGNTRGTLIGLLVPALNQSGRPVRPSSASVNILNAEGQRQQQINFCDGSV
jgi:hypothetical protein